MFEIKGIRQKTKISHISTWRGGVLNGGKK